MPSPTRQQNNLITLKKQTPNLTTNIRINQRLHKPKGFLQDDENHPIFGFNNPNPQPDSKEYGYELWMKVGSDVESEGTIEVKDYPGGLFAVTTCKLIEDPSGRNILETWKALWEWVKASKYKWRQVHELEKVHDPMASETDIILDLYLPIEEK